MLWLYVNHGAWIPDKTSNELTTGLLECFRKMGGGDMDELHRHGDPL